MMLLHSPAAVAVTVAVALLLAGWTLAAGWAVLAARARVRRAEAAERLARKLTRMVDEAPALPLLVRADGRIEGASRLAGWLGLDAMPGYLTELDGGGRGLDAETLASLAEAVRHTQKTGAPLSLSLVPRGGVTALAVRGSWPIRRSHRAARRCCGSSMRATASPKSARCGQRLRRPTPISPAWPD
jgi:hypothetical protein